MFGLANAPSYFTCLMQRTLDPLRKFGIMCFFDGGFIVAETVAEALRRLRMFFDALREARLTVILSKCRFPQKRVPYLGFEISADGIEPGGSKVEAIKRYPEPTDIHQLRRFMGMIGFFRTFISACALESQPLLALQKANTPYHWGDDEQTSFDTLKSALTSKPVLQIYDPERETDVHTDPCKGGLSGMLLQRGENGKFHLVYTVSRRTSVDESNYASSRLEMVAIVWSVIRMRNFLINIKFTVVTDCEALMHIHVGSTKNPQMIRWQNELSEYDYDIRHRPGIKMLHVDALSRAPVEDVQREVFSISRIEDELLVYQRGDADIQRKIQLLKKTEDGRSAAEKGEIDGFEVQHGLLYKNEEGKLKLVRIKALRKSLTVRYHDLQGHFGLDRTLHRIKEFYYFPGIRKYVRQHIRSCLQCMATKSTTGHQPGELHPIAPGRRPFAIVHIDHLGPFVSLV